MTTTAMAMDMEANQNRTQGTIVTNRGRVVVQTQLHNVSAPQSKSRNQCTKEPSIEYPYESVKKQMNALRTKIRKNELQKIIEEKSIDSLKQSLQKMITVLDEFEKKLNMRKNEEVTDDDLCMLFGNLLKPGSNSNKSPSLSKSPSKSQSKKRKTGQNGGNKKNK